MNELNALRRARNTLVIKVRYWKRQLQSGRHDDSGAVEALMGYTHELEMVREEILMTKERLAAAKEGAAIVITTPDVAEWKPLMWVEFP
jgi:hypothetical protein